MWVSKSHTGLAVFFSVPVLKYMGDNLWWLLYHQQAITFQFPTRINQISYKLTIGKEADGTSVNITINVKHFKYNHSNKCRKTQTLNYSVQERRKAKRDCYIIFCNSEKLSPLHLWATAVKYSKIYGIWNRFSKEKDVPLSCQPWKCYFICCFPMTVIVNPKHESCIILQLILSCLWI